MSNTITIRKAFSSGDDAAAARDRLACAVFAREDIAVDQVMCRVAANCSKEGQENAPFARE